METEFEMTSVTSTRELRPVPKMLQEMVKDPTSLRVMYHGAGRDHKDPPFQVRPHNFEKEQGPSILCLHIQIMATAMHGSLAKAGKHMLRFYPLT